MLPSLSVAVAVSAMLAGTVKLALLAGAVILTTGDTLGGAFTMRLVIGEMLGALLTSPPYSAVMLCTPTAPKLATAVSTPAVIVPAPIGVAPSLKVTVPVGELPVTIAVRVMA